VNKCFCTVKIAGLSGSYVFGLSNCIIGIDFAQALGGCIQVVSVAEIWQPGFLLCGMFVQFVFCCINVVS